MSRWLLLGLVVAVAPLAVGCSSGGGRPLDGGLLDVPSFDYRFGDLPPGCPPETGNDKGIGTPCSKGGGECTNNLLCTCDLGMLGVPPPDDTPCFCTDVKLSPPSDTRRPCEQRPADSCGQDAVCCDYRNVGSLCIPTICLENMCPQLSL